MAGWVVGTKLQQLYIYRFTDHKVANGYELLSKLKTLCRLEVPRILKVGLVR